jgi:antitoxin (DNA-binding transcriptional repressor) of toxin-antitoxin stability system
MVTVSSTQFRKDLFGLLQKVSGGEIISVVRHKHEIARVVPPVVANWRENMTIKPELIVSADKVMEPIKDVWQDHI